MTQYTQVNPAYAGTASNSVIKTRDELKEWLLLEKARYGVTGNHIADDDKCVDAIWNASQEYDVDPVVILTKLQQEKGLLSSSYTPDKLNWAMGYGCYDNQPWDENYKGFDKQVYSAARRIRDLKQEYESLPPSDRIITVDGREYQAQTVADYIGYTYTPHEQGAKAFNEVLESREKTYNMFLTKFNSTGPDWNSAYGFNAVGSRDDILNNDPSKHEVLKKEIKENAKNKYVTYTKDPIKIKSIEQC